MLKPLVRSLVALSLVTACDSTSTSGNSDGSAATEQQMAAYCDAQCNRDEACPDPSITKPANYDCRAACRSKMGSNLVLRAASIDAMTACYKSLACDESDDQCSAAGILAVTNDPENFTGVQSCLMQHENCQSDATGGFSDDLCFDQILLVPSAASQFDNCLRQACASVHDCFKAILGAS